MNNKIQVFNNDEFGSVRTVTIDGEPWFVGKDVAVALGYESPSATVSKKVDNEDKKFVMLDIADFQNGNVLVGQSKTAIINESGLYSLVLSSKLPSAKKFKRWITSEVIPSIRKHGAYMTDNLLDSVIDNPDLMREVIEKLGADRNKVKRLENELKAALPKAVYFDVFVDPGYTTNFRDTAKEFGIPQKCFINLLIEHGYIFRTQRGELRPSSEALKSGLFVLKDYTSPVNFHRGTYTLVTAKGKKYIYEYFAKKKIV